MSPAMTSPSTPLPQGFESSPLAPTTALTSTRVGASSIMTPVPLDSSMTTPLPLPSSMMAETFAKSNLERDVAEAVALLQRYPPPSFFNDTNVENDGGNGNDSIAVEIRD